MIICLPCNYMQYITVVVVWLAYQLYPFSNGHLCVISILEIDHVICPIANKFETMQWLACTREDILVSLFCLHIFASFFKYWPSEVTYKYQTCITVLIYYLYAKIYDIKAVLCSRSQSPWFTAKVKRRRFASAASYVVVEISFFWS